MLRKISCLGLAVLAFSSFAKEPNELCVPAQSGTQFVSGDGTADTPYLICNRVQLDRIGSEGELLNKHFILGTDINYSNYTFNVIGSESSPFKGRFDGDGYYLGNVIIPKLREEYLSLFGYVDGATIENLSVEGVSIPTGNKHVGGLIGFAKGATLTNLHTNIGSIAASQYVGGIAGELVDSQLTSSSSRGVLTQFSGAYATGGLVGYSKNVDIKACRSFVLFYPYDKNANNITALGGLVGYANKTRIQNAYSISQFRYDLSSQPVLKQTGGLAGVMEKGAIKNSFFAGRFVLNVDDDTIGGVVGKDIGKVGAQKVFWDSQVSKMEHSAIGKKKTETIMKTKSFWLSQGFDEHIWKIMDGNYPTLWGVDRFYP